MIWGVMEGRLRGRIIHPIKAADKGRVGATSRRGSGQRRQQDAGATGREKRRDGEVELAATRWEALGGGKAGQETKTGGTLARAARNLCVEWCARRTGSTPT